MSTTTQDRRITKDLRHGNSVVVDGRDIYASKGTYVPDDTGALVREQGPMERVGGIDHVTYTEGVVTINTLRVVIYSHRYPREFPLSGMSAAQDYALSLFS